MGYNPETTFISFGPVEWLISIFRVVASILVFFYCVSGVGEERTLQVSSSSLVCFSPACFGWYCRNVHTFLGGSLKYIFNFVVCASNA